MNVQFTAHAWEDYNYWLQFDTTKVDKINELIRSIRQNPFKGIGSPEPLRHDLQGFWSRRISGEHRLVYKVEGKKGEDQKCSVIQCRFHYDVKS